MSNAYIQLVQSQLVPLLIKDQTRKFCRFRVTSNATCVGKNLLAEFALAFYTPLPPEKFQIRDMLRYSRSEQKKCLLLKQLYKNKKTANLKTRRGNIGKSIKVTFRTHFRAFCYR